MKFKINYVVKDRMSAADISDISLNADIGSRFDRFAYERVYGEFAITEVLKEAEKCFEEQYDDEFCSGMWRGEFWGKLIISAVRVCKMKGNERLKKDISASVYRLLKFQDSEGYLSTYRNSKNIFKTTIEQAMKEVGWACDYNWNIWGQKRTLS